MYAVDENLTSSKNLLIFTTFNREVDILSKTLEGLNDQINQDFDLLIVDDGSTTDDLARALANEYNNLGNRLTVLFRDTKRARPETYQVGPGYNNPAYAFNCGINYANQLEYDNIFFMSSDVWLEPEAFENILKHDLSSACVHGFTHDPKDKNHPNGVYCASWRPRPLGWFWGTSLSNVLKCYYDESFLAGIAYEDGDFTARCAIEAGQVIIDDNIRGLHQYHVSHNHQFDQSKGCHINAQIAAQKWGGNASPWEGHNTIQRKIISNNDGVLVFEVQSPHYSRSNF